jgi:hypothetical protein
MNFVQLGAWIVGLSCEYHIPRDLSKIWVAGAVREMPSWHLRRRGAPRDLSMSWVSSNEEARAPEFKHRLSHMNDMPKA